MKKKGNLNRIFGSNARVRILGYLFFEKKESYIRELARELKISPSAVKREVDNLEQVGIVKKEDRGIVLNESNSVVDDLKNIFMKADFIVYPIKNVLNNKKIEFVFIFGSFARGDYSEDSDVDLMVIGDVSLDEVIRKVSLAEKKIRKDINPVVWTVENLEKEKKSSFVKDVFKKGIIMIKGEEDEVRRIVK